MKDTTQLSLSAELIFQLPIAAFQVKSSEITNPSEVFVSSGLRSFSVDLNVSEL